MGNNLDTISESNQRGFKQPNTNPATLPGLQGVFGPKWDEFRSSLVHHFNAYPILPVRLTANQERMAELVRKGIVVLPRYLDAERVKAIRSQVYVPIQALQGNLLDIPAQHVDRLCEQGMYRLYDIDQFFEQACRSFKEDPVIQDLVQAYLSNQAYHCRMAAELRTLGTGTEPEATMLSCTPHTDHYLREVKVFAFLEDVTEDNAPMIYWAGSHVDAPWRWIADYMRHVGLSVDNGDRNYTHYTANRLEKEEGFAKVTCTGPAGTVIIADMRGLHRGGIIRRGYRLQIFSQYRMTPVVDYH